MKPSRPDPHEKHDSTCPGCGACYECDPLGCACLGIDNEEAEFWMFGDGQPQ